MTGRGHGQKCNDNKIVFVVAVFIVAVLVVVAFVVVVFVVVVFVVVVFIVAASKKRYFFNDGFPKPKLW